jgi:hypothetical protein
MERLFRSLAPFIGRAVIPAVRFEVWSVEVVACQYWRKLLADGTAVVRPA